MTLEEFDGESMTPINQQPTCEERLPGHLADRLEDFRAMLRRDDYDVGDDELGPLNEYPLGASIRYAVRVELSTGGPADYLEYIVDDGEVTRATYHFADWWDHAEQSLTGDDLETAEQFLEALYGELSDLGEYMKQ